MRRSPAGKSRPGRARARPGSTSGTTGRNTSGRNTSGRNTSERGKAGSGDTRHGANPRGGNAHRTDPRGANPRREREAVAHSIGHSVALGPAPKILPGTWLWTTRPFADVDLVDELNAQLALNAAPTVRRLGPAVVQSVGAPAAHEGDLDLTFARQGFLLQDHIESDQPSDLHERVIARAATALADSKHETLAISVFVPDDDSYVHANAAADRLREALLRRPNMHGMRDPRARTVTCFHVTVVSPTEVFVGTTTPETTLSYADGGRARMRVHGERPSRAARKVEEALAWLGLSPGSGEVCVDMGAAPGGWTWSLLEKRCRVIAVDPAKLRPDIAKHTKLTHIQGSAFSYAPDEPVDWLFGDMAWRPHEVAEMAAKWGRQRWARFLVMNFKLPMKKKWEMVVRIRAILAQGGWKRVRSRQLYHDRDEITITAHL